MPDLKLLRLPGVLLDERNVTRAAIAPAQHARLQAQFESGSMDLALIAAPRQRARSRSQHGSTALRSARPLPVPALPGNA
ncbi:hypothetical protein [Paraburkholderia silvatlantica]|uniref:Uncharacterized protein n=1 Tax=Paraburkholderia silvatlantica TaxID=321895 RepID=A0ABR6FHW3_9BURK|nr:hypothetical protein [Paraburkholderia silvatlantica]MBB2926159.1 hypothetical protein [Paraburkholderia silvatlantica]